MKTKPTLCLGILLVCSIFPLFSQSLYVSTNGNDSQSGSAQFPLQSIQAAANVATAGTTVYVMGGTYRENITLNTHSGNSGNPIVFKNYDQAEVIIDGGGTSVAEGTAIVELKDVSYIEIRGFTFRNIKKRFAKGLIIREGCSDISVNDNIFTEIHFSDNPNATVTYSDNASPLVVYGTNAAQAISNITMRGNEIYNCRTGYSEGMSFSGNVDGFLVEDNYVHDITNIGIHAEGHFGTCQDPLKDQARNGVIRNNIVHDCASNVAIAGGIYIDGARDVVIENNRSYNGQLGISVGCENVGKSASNIVVRNNVIYNNSETGIEIGGYDYPSNSGIVENAIVTGNTSFKNDTGNQWIGELWVTYNNNLTVENNIFYAENDQNVVYYYDANNGTGNTFNHNLYNLPSGAANAVFTVNGIGYNSFAQYVQGTGYDTQSQFVDPLFMDASNGDFHVEATSPAVDAGNPTFIPATGELDMDGENRMYSVVDCGADEFQEVLGVPSASSSEEITIYPNPTKGDLYLTGSEGTISYTVFSILGTAVLAGSTGNSYIDLTNLQSGIYIIKLRLPETGYEQSVKLIRR